MEKIKQGLTIRDLLKIPHFKDAVLLGGEAGLEQTISRINVMEVPDVVDWVRPGEFLMTTGYPFRNELEVMESLIADLALKGVVALGIKTKRFIDRVPENAIKAANLHGLPLIELPPGTSFSDVVREVMERVLVEEYSQLSDLRNRVQCLSHVLLHGDGLSAFLMQLQKSVGNPVVLLDGNNSWTASPDAVKLCEQMTERDWQKLRLESSLETSFLEIDGRNTRVYFSSVLEEVQPYLLLMFEHQHEYDIVDTLTMNWASKLVGFEISNALARRNIEAKYIGQFLQDWIAGRIVSPVDLQLRAEACGFAVYEGSSYMAGIIHFYDRKLRIIELQDIAKRLNWDRTAGDRMDIKWTIMEEELVVLISSRMEQNNFRAFKKEEMNPVMSLLRTVLSHQKFRFCLGRRVLAQGEVPTSYKEAKRAVEVSTVCQIDDEVIYYGNLGTYMLLYRLIETDEAVEFKKEYLQPILQYDNKGQNQGTLLKTIKVYFECNCNVKETADRMFLHYNTVIYRLDRIKTELGFHLDDPEVRLQLQLAIKLNQIKKL